MNIEYNEFRMYATAYHLRLWGEGTRTANSSLSYMGEKTLRKNRSTDHTMHYKVNQRKRNFAILSLLK